MSRAKDHAAVLSALAKALKRCPHLRVGQLIVNALPPTWSKDPFYLTDETLASALDDYPKKGA